MKAALLLLALMAGFAPAAEPVPAPPHSEHALSAGEGTTVIEIDTKLRESPIAGMPITQYRPASRGSQQYRILAQELTEYVKEEASRQTA